MTDVKIQIYTPELKETWNRFIEESNNGTIFHNLDFLSYHGDKFKKNEHHLMFYKGNNLIGVMPLGLFEEDGKFVARSPFGASFGGLVTKPFTPFRYYKAMIDKFLEYLNKLGVNEIYIVPPPSIYYKVYTNYFEFLLYLKGFKLINRAITHVINLELVKNDPLNVFEKRAIRAYNKSKKLLRIEEKTKNIEIFYKILLNTMNRHKSKPTHTLDEIRRLHDLIPNNIKIDLAYYDDKPVGGIMYFICNSRVVLAFYNCHVKEYRNLNSINFLIYHGIRWARERGFKYIDLGTSADMNIVRDSLIMFKESVGGVGVFRDYYLYQNQTR